MEIQPRGLEHNRQILYQRCQPQSVLLGLGLLSVLSREIAIILYGCIFPAGTSRAECGPGRSTEDSSLASTRRKWGYP